MNGVSIIDAALEAARDAKLDKVTIDKLELLALPEIKELTPDQIRELRERSKLSRAAWARVLNVGTTTVQKWEAGSTKPEGAAVKLLNIVNTQGVATLLH